MQKIRAAICRAFGEDFTIEEVHLRAPMAGEVEVKIAACAVCHSDFSYHQGGWPAPLPAVYGHEAAGTVTAVGEGVSGIAPGDAVLVTLVRSCGTCPACINAHPANCEAGNHAPDGPITLPDGSPVHQGLDAGAFAEAVVVDRSQVVKIPADMPMEAAALISCGVITGVGAAVNTAGIRPGDDVVVIGAGGVGLNAIQGARIAGARRIVAVDLNPEKLDVAREFGATHGVAGEGKPWQEAKAIFGGRGADAVLVAVGAAPVYDQAVRYLAPGGRLVAVGLPRAGAGSSFQMLGVGRFAQTITGSYMGDVVLERDVPWIVDLYRQGRLRLDELISGRWTLEQINEAFADTRSGAARRNVIVFGD